MTLTRVPVLVEFPARRGRPLGTIVPVTHPGVGQHRWRIELGDLPVGFEVAYSVYHNLSAGIAGLKPPFAAQACIHSQTEVLQISSPHQRMSCAGSVSARNTRSGGAATSTSPTMASRSGVISDDGILLMAFTLNRGRASPPVPLPLLNLFLAPKVKDFLLLFAVVAINPLLGVVICVRH